MTPHRRDLCPPGATPALTTRAMINIAALAFDDLCPSNTLGSGSCRAMIVIEGWLR